MPLLPAPMPLFGAAGQVFDIDRVDYTAPEAGGRLGGVQAGFPLWFMDIDTQSMDFQSAVTWRAFLRQRRGSMRRFIAYDLLHLYPTAHPDGFARMTYIDGTPFAGAAASWSQAIDDDGQAFVTLEGLPSGIILSVEDMIGFRWDASGSPAGSSDRRTVVSVVVGGRADSTGSITVMVEPPVPTGVVPAGAVAHLDMPGCLMKLNDASSRLGRNNPGYVEGGKVSATQDLLP